MLKHQDIGSKGTISPLGDEFFMRFVSGVRALLEYRGVILNLFPQMGLTAPSLSIFEKPVKMQVLGPHLRHNDIPEWSGVFTAPASWLPEFTVG